jgi:hypothetical protein
MKLASAIEGGVTGATTLSLLQEALHKIDAKAPRPLLHKSGILKQLKKKSGKGNKHELYIKLAGELLGNAAFFGMAGLGKRKNAVLTGGLLGAAAGLGTAFLQEDEEGENGFEAIDNGFTRDELEKKLMTVALYTAGGLLAGVAIKKLKKKSLKKIRKALNLDK